MHRKLALVLGLLCFPMLGGSWGFHGHKTINRLAVYTLPSELMAFFKEHIEFVADHAVDPDMRRYAIEEEGARHYIDIDHYGPDPFEVVPQRWDSAVSCYSEDTLQAYGIVPWHVQRMYYRLVLAFRKKDVPFILKTAADLGHYIADAHVPLHTTENYNGQLTGQHGIHGFWESRLPELYSEDYDFLVGRAVILNDPLVTIWEAVESSHMAVDSVLRFEKDLSQRFSADQKYAFEDRGRSTVHTYSRAYSLSYHTLLEGMVERRMRRSIRCIGSFWYSAWIEAGQPDLDAPLDPEVLIEMEAERADWQAKRTESRIKGHVD